MRLLPIWTLALAGLLLSSWPAAAQTSREAIELRNQIYELQQQVQALRQQIGQGAAVHIWASPALRRRRAAATTWCRSC